MADPADIAATIRRLSRKRVYIGIPQQNDPRPGDPIGNASLGYIHELGSPAQNIPARPHLVPGIEAVMPQITAYLAEAARAALTGDEGAVNAALEKAGITGRDSVRLTIQAGIPPPLKPATVRQRRNRGTGSTYRRRAMTPADVTPLIDTGAYLAAITYVVRDE